MECVYLTGIIKTFGPPVRIGGSLPASFPAKVLTIFRLERTKGVAVMVAEG